MTDSTIGKYPPGQHPDLPPPPNTTGPLVWIWKNLFGTTTNTILTLLSVWLIWSIVPGVVDYFFLDAVVNAESRQECREIASGACWAVIVERFNVSLYAFYPEDERWRAILAFFLLFVALGPLLFDKFPARRKMFLFSCIYPFLALILIVGPLEIESMSFANGGIGPYVWIVLFLAGIAGIAVNRTKGNNTFGIIGYTLIAITAIPFILSQALWVSGADMVGLANSANEDFLLPPVSTDRLGGVMLTLIIGITGITFSLPLGILLALGRVSKLPAMRIICVGFIEFIRGVPLIALLFVASTMLNYFLPPGVEFDLVLRVLIMVTLFASAYIAEVVRGGLQAIPKGQYEAADAMGLKYWQSMRLIILPQALKISIPGIVNTFIGLYKDTTLVIIIGLFDVLGIMRNTLSDPKWNGLSTEAYVYTAVFFFISCFAMSRYSLWLEKKLHTGHKR